jgi:hypothetical protein
MGVFAPPLEPFATPDELRAFLDNPAIPQAQAEWLVDWGSASVRAEVGQTVNVVEDDEVVLDADGSEMVLLPELAVLGVTSVSLGDVLVEPHHYDWSKSGCLWRVGGGWRYASGAWSREVQTRQWPWRPRALTVVYDHGWGPQTPQWQAARQVALEIAAKALRSPEGLELQSERIGDWSRSWMPTGGRGAELAESSQRLLDILRPGR